MSSEKKQAIWWGHFDLDRTEIKKWQIGERWIAIRRAQNEWTVWDHQTDHEVDLPVEVSTATDDELLDVDYSRYLVGQTTEGLIIEPSLADRSVIARPGKPFILMPGQEVQLYVSTPLWLTVLTPNVETPMADIPFWRPSDSWFGPSTMVGDLCYSKYTDAKTQHQSLEKRTHRATTLVALKNEQDDALKVERINLPVPALKLYANSKQEFWTDNVNIVQEMENGKSISRVTHVLPEDLNTKHQVSESRELSKKPSFLSSIKNLIG